MGILTIIGCIVLGFILVPVVFKIAIGICAIIFEICAGLLRFLGEIMVTMFGALVFGIGHGFKQLKKMHQHKRKYGRSL